MSFKKFWEKLGRLLSEPYILLAKCLPLQDKVVFCNYFGRGMADDPKFIALELLRRKAPVKAWFKPRICARIFSETASPEASSPARLILIPEESFSMLFDWLRS